ncbi:MAG: gliding motility-associated C-terminal domain-containing protein [Chitinophagales bacterium]|nr:gliding motility-associated C-terminal domain-containing protein [Chitinophagales bacterium]MCZ2394119.1 gliding motility-associated C-terminal domain-containing protein [Chitinophagales bacterium]
MIFFRLFFLLLFISSIQNIYACDGTDFQLDINDASCYNTSTGSIEILPTLISDNLPYQYSLNGGIFTSQNLFSNLPAGSYQLVVRNNKGCDSLISNLIEILQPEELKLNIIAEPIICGNDAKLYAQISGGSGPYLYQWNNNPSMNTDTLRRMSAGTYQLEITDQNKCSANDTILINDKLPFSVVATSSSYDIIVGEEINLNAQVSGGGSNISYQWFPIDGIDCNNCQETTAKIFKSSEIYVVANDLDNGCMASDTLYIAVKGEFSLYIPNAFSPNGDNKNDIFLVYGIGIQEATSKIYDKNGFLVFEGEVLASGWDGKVNDQNALSGLYFYHCSISYFDGTIREQKGQLTLIR